jgi:hypothetical protein
VVPLEVHVPPGPVVITTVAEPPNVVPCTLVRPASPDAMRVSEVAMNTPPRWGPVQGQSL